MLKITNAMSTDHRQYKHRQALEPERFGAPYVPSQSSRCRTHPGRVGLVELVQHDHGGAAVVEHQPPEVGGGAGQRVRGHDESGLPVEAVGEGGVDVVVALALRGDQEGQRSVGREHVHAAVFLPVPGQQRDAALLHVQVRGHRVQRLGGTKEREKG